MQTIYIMIRTTKLKISIVFGLLFFVGYSCKDLEEMNVNPNGVDPSGGHPSLFLSTIESSLGTSIVDLGFGNIAGVMQHTQKDGWSGAHNSYDWTNEQSWSGFYGILRNTDEMYNKAVEMDMVFYQGAALVLKAYTFGLITDLWGDAPYSSALKGEQGGEENIKPAFDRQADIYAGILEDLATANTLLSGDQADYSGIRDVQDLLLEGEVEKWQKFANSLALRYYMRLSEKDPAKAQAGINKIVNDPDTYPLILSNNDDVNLSYYGNSAIDSWPTNTVFNKLEQGSYRRLKMCAILVDKLQTLSDPRLALWAEKIDVPLVAVASPADRDEIVDGIRYIGPEVVDEYESFYGVLVDYDADYIGLPPAWSAVPQAYNLNTSTEQAPVNPHASMLNERYMNAFGPLLKARLMSAAEVHFILAEAALKGWASGGSAQSHYEDGIRTSLEAWEVGSEYSSYISNVGVVYDGTLEQIIEQKWIASWSAAAESWFDFRRTGLPALQPGTVVKRDALPLRFYYGIDEIDFNLDNANAAIELLEETAYSMEDGKNSAWSKMWLITN